MHFADDPGSILIGREHLLLRNGTNAGVNVTIEQTPEISAGSADGDRWVISVRIRFYANI